MPVANSKFREAGGLVDPVVFHTTTIIDSGLCPWRILSFPTPKGSSIPSSSIRQQLLIPVYVGGKFQVFRRRRARRSRRLPYDGLLIPVYAGDKILSFATSKGSLRSLFFMREQNIINTMHYMCYIIGKQRHGHVVCMHKL